MSEDDKVLELRRKNFVPGRMRCAKCRFVLTSMTMNANSGQIGEGKSEAQQCPNGCGPLWPVTWEDEARATWTTAEQLFERAFKAEAIIKRFVAMLEPAKHWWVIVANPGLSISSVQTFEAFGVDPQQCAVDVFAAHPRLADGFELVAVIEAGGKVFLRDDNRADEFGIQPGG